MNAEKPAKATKTPKAARDADRKSNAGLTPEPWEMCARIEYGGDRSFATSVREQVIGALPEERGRVEELLLKALAQRDATDAGRAFVCQMLALVGTAKSVPALTALLRDMRTVESARYALQAIPGAEASAALRDALGALTGRAKIGLLGTIAARRDAAARPALAAVKDNASEPADVREAAARALEALAPLSA